MPYLNGHATSFDNLIQQVIDWTTDESIHGDDAWELMRNEPWPKGTILKAHGWEDGEKQYIGLMPQTFRINDTYPKWFCQPEILAREFVYNKKGLGLPIDAKNVSIGTNYVSVGVYNSVTGEAPTTYTFSSPDIFSSNSQALFFGVFKQYSDGLDWHEQAGGATQPVRPKDVKYWARNPRYTTYNPTNFSPPTYPGVGFPSIGIDVGGFVDGLAEFWLIKDRHRLIITINNGGFWEVVHVGFFEPYHKPNEYAFPACVIGGTSGVMPVIEPYRYYNSQYYTWEAGCKFDYSPRNWLLTHGNVLFASTYWDGLASWSDDQAVSQAQVMLPDGTWQSFYNYAIRKELVTEHYYYGEPPYQVVNKEPEQPSVMNNYIRPTYTNLSDTANIYHQDGDIKNTYQLEPIEFVQKNPHTSTNNVLGKLWRMYWSSNRVARYGKQRINGKLHLVLPNTWETRKFHMPHGLYRVMSDAAILAYQTRIEKISNTMNCIIRLED